MILDQPSPNKTQNIKNIITETSIAEDVMADGINASNSYETIPVAEGKNSKTVRANVTKKLSCDLGGT